MAEFNRSDVLDGYVHRLIRIKARQLLRHRGFSRSDLDDLVQELTLRLWRQVTRFDPTRASFHTYAAHVLDSCAATIVRERRRLKRAAGLQTQSVDSTLINRGAQTLPLADLLSEADLYRRRGGSSPRERQRWTDLSQAVAGLPPELRDLCRRLMSATPTSVARDLGVTRRQVRNAIALIRRHLEKAGLEDS